MDFSKQGWSRHHEEQESEVGDLVERNNGYRGNGNSSSRNNISGTVRNGWGSRTSCDAERDTDTGNSRKRRNNVNTRDYDDCLSDEENERNEKDQIFSCRIENSKIMTEILLAIHASGTGSGSKDQSSSFQICEVKVSYLSVMESVFQLAC